MQVGPIEVGEIIHWSDVFFENITIYVMFQRLILSHIAVFIIAKMINGLDCHLGSHIMRKPEKHVLSK